MPFGYSTSYNFGGAGIEYGLRGGFDFSINPIAFNFYSVAKNYIFDHNELLAQFLGHIIPIIFREF